MRRLLQSEEMVKDLEGQVIRWVMDESSRFEEKVEMEDEGRMRACGT